MSSDHRLDRSVLASGGVDGVSVDDDDLADLVARYWSTLDDEIRSAQMAYGSTTPIPCVRCDSRKT
jgi:hypothetical protein